MTILGTLVGSLVTLFTSGAKAEADLNRRFQAQTEARLALDLFRREVHNACEVTLSGFDSATGRYTTATLKTLQSTPEVSCFPVSATWCVVGTTPPYSLYRQAGSSCDASGVRRGTELTQKGVFTVLTATKRLPRVGFDLTVNTRPAESRLAYRLEDAIVLRNALGRG